MGLVVLLLIIGLVACNMAANRGWNPTKGESGQVARVFLSVVSRGGPGGGAV